MVNIKRKRIILASERDKISFTNKKSETASEKEKVIKRSRSRSHDNSSRDKKKSKKEKKLKWIIPGIIVRVISKKVANGKLYNKKIKITDVLNESKFLAVPEGSEDSNGGN